MKSERLEYSSVVSTMRSTFSKSPSGTRAPTYVVRSFLGTVALIRSGLLSVGKAIV